MYNVLSRAFDALDVLLARVGDAWRAFWRLLWNGPLQSLLFYLLIGFVGLKIVFEWVVEGVDRIIAWLEKAIISVSLLAMVALTFLDYLRREFTFDFEIRGGSNMAMVLLIWVGFLGASLATRNQKHLAVDATDRVLAPGAASFMKRFTALIAAGLCWKLMKLSWLLAAEGLEFEDTQEGLWVWDWLVEPMNAVVSLLPAEGGEVNWARLIAAGIIAAVALWQVKCFERPVADPKDPKVWIGKPIFAAIAGLTGGVALLSALPLFWEPTLEFGDPVEWPVVEPGDGFPLWLAQAVLPLGFAIMSARFFVAALLGRFETPVEERDLEDEALESAAAPKPIIGNRTPRDVVVAGLFPGVLLGLGAALYFGIGKLILVCAILLILIGAPLFVGIGVATLACVMLISETSGLSVATDMFEACKKQELLAIPFFVLAGNIMTEGSLADRLIGVARAAMGRVPGGLGLATIFACVIFAAISGSSPVTVIAVGSILFPMLVKEGYPESYSLGVLSSAGSLGIIIPPSVPMIVYAIMVSTPQRQVSPIDLFLAGVLPGLFIASMLAFYTLYRTRPSALRGLGLQLQPPEGSYFGNLAAAMKKGALAMLLPVLILGGIYGLLGPIRFTINEAAAVAVVYALFIELVVHREMKVSDLPKVLSQSGVMMGSLFLIIVLAIAFNKFLTLQQVPQMATEWLANHVDSTWQFIILVNIFLLLLGCVMEILSAILIVAPLLAPIADHFGLHPIHFGIMFIVNLELGYLTPPLGINLFVASTVFERPIVQVIKSALPFLLIMLFCLIVIAWFPALSLALLE